MSRAGARSTSSEVMMGIAVSDAPAPEPPVRSLLPREHGASMELAFPLLCAFALGTPTWGSIAYAVAAILAFLSHEALLVLLGRRGARQAERAGVAARRWLFALGSAAVLLGVPALLSFSPLARALALVPVALALAVLALTMRGVRERSLGVELLVVAALATLALPVALEGGAPLATALAATATWSVGFGVGTFAARGVLYRQKDAGRGLGLARAVGVGALVVGLAAAALAPAWWRYVLGPAPFAVAAIVLGTRPPPPTRMTAIGFALVAASTITLVLLATGEG